MPSCTVLHRIEGRDYTDVLVRGLPTIADVDELTQGRGGKVYKAIWPGKWVVRLCER